MDAKAQETLEEGALEVMLREAKDGFELPADEAKLVLEYLFRLEADLATAKERIAKLEEHLNKSNERTDRIVAARTQDEKITKKAAKKHGQEVKRLNRLTNKLSKRVRLLESSENLDLSTERAKVERLIDLQQKCPGEDHFPDGYCDSHGLDDTDCPPMSKCWQQYLTTETDSQDHAPTDKRED